MDYEIPRKGPSCETWISSQITEHSSDKGHTFNTHHHHAMLGSNGKCNLIKSVPPKQGRKASSTLFENTKILPNI